jgi:hypothetical protein
MLKNAGRFHTIKYPSSIKISIGLHIDDITPFKPSEMRLHLAQPQLYHTDGAIYDTTSARPAAYQLMKALHPIGVVYL